MVFQVKSRLTPRPRLWLKVETQLLRNSRNISQRLDQAMIGSVDTAADEVILGTRNEGGPLCLQIQICGIFISQKKLYLYAKFFVAMELARWDMTEAAQNLER